MAPDYLHELAGPFRIDAEGPDAVLLLHGWTGSPAHLRIIGGVLQDQGFGVDAPLYAGHATTIEDMAQTGWRDWVRSAAEGAQRIVGRGQRLHVLGLSMGGIIGTLLAPPFGAASLTTVNAPIRTRSRLVNAARFVKYAQPVRPGKHDPPPGDEAAEYWHHYAGSPLGTVEDLLLLIKAARRNLGRVRCPTLIIQSRVDETVRPESARLLFDGIGARSKRIVWLEESRHVALLDAERDVIHREVLRHLATS